MSAVGPAQCPICDRELSGRSHRKLFDVPICRKCSNAFANRRQLAWILDALLWWLVVTLVQSVFFYMFIDIIDAYDDAGLIGTILWLVYVWIFLPMVFYCKDGFRGYSPGKWLCGVRVIDWNTREPIGFLQSFKRNLCLLIPFVIIFVAFQLIRGRRRGDYWANTGVIWVKKAHRMPFEPRGILCTHCGYDLTGNVSGRCPECGNDIPARQAVLALPTIGTA